MEGLEVGDRLEITLEPSTEATKLSATYPEPPPCTETLGFVPGVVAAGVVNRFQADESCETGHGLLESLTGWVVESRAVAVAAGGHGAILKGAIRKEDCTGVVSLGVGIGGLTRESQPPLWSVAVTFGSGDAASEACPICRFDYPATVRVNP